MLRSLPRIHQAHQGPTLQRLPQFQPARRRAADGAVHHAGRHPQPRTHHLTHSLDPACRSPAALVSRRRTAARLLPLPRCACLPWTCHGALLPDHAVNSSASTSVCDAGPHAALSGKRGRECVGFARGHQPAGCGIGDDADARLPEPHDDAHHGAPALPAVRRHVQGRPRVGPPGLLRPSRAAVAHADGRHPAGAPQPLHRAPYPGPRAHSQVCLSTATLCHP